MTTFVPTVAQVEHACAIATAIVTSASILANLLPHPEKTEGILGKVSKVVNFIALNITKFDK